MTPVEKKFIDVQIPEALINYVLEEKKYCGRYVKKRKSGNTTHHLMKLYGFYLLLKAEAPGSGLIQNYTKQIDLLSSHFNLSRRTFYNYMIALEKLQLLMRDADGHLHIASWKKLGEMVQISTRKRKTIKFYYDQKQKIHWWFAALEIKSNQELQQDTVWKKANKNSEVASMLLDALIKRGFDISKLKNPEYYAGRLFRLYLEDFETGTEVHDLLINIRADVNRSCKKIGEAWEISPQLTSYWKKQMQGQKIINVSKLTVTSKWSLQTKECHKNKFCHVIWNDKLKERVWFLCDQINVLRPGEWEEWLAKNMVENEAVAA